MAYRIVDVELTEPLAELTLGDAEHGIAVLARYRGHPLGFALRRAAPGSTLDADALRRRLPRDIASLVLAESVRRELRGDREAPAVSLTVAVCTRDRVSDLERCLRSLIAIRADDSADPRHFEILVIDNAPPDGGTRALVAGLGDVRYSCEPVPGLDVARNRALHEATGEIVAFLDDDVVVDPGWLRGLEETLAGEPGVGLVTGNVLPHELETDAQVTFERRGGFGRGFETRVYAGDRLPGNVHYPLGSGIFGAGCNMAVRRDLVIGLGGFDEALDTGPPLPGGGDLDIFYRVARSGRPLVYEPSMLVFHRHRREERALRQQYRSWGEGFMAYLMKTYRCEPWERRRIRALMTWWAGYQFRELRRSFRSRTPGSPDLVLAELAGGVVGVAGATGDRFDEWTGADGTTCEGVRVPGRRPRRSRCRWAG